MTKQIDPCKQCSTLESGSNVKIYIMNYEHYCVFTVIIIIYVFLIRLHSRTELSLQPNVLVPRR